MNKSILKMKGYIILYLQLSYSDISRWNTENSLLVYLKKLTAATPEPCKKENHDFHFF